MITVQRIWLILQSKIQVQQYLMGEYNITKIIDGLFISDQNVTFDPLFLMSNKIIRMLGWTAEAFYHNWQEQGIEEFILHKNVQEVKFPDFKQLEEGFTHLDTIIEEMLCGLIYSQSQLQASLICIMYLMRRYRWDHSTAYEFLRTKMEMFECSDQTLQELEKYEQALMKAQSIKLSHIVWQYDFLVSYKPASEQETLLLTTIKNKMRGSREECKVKKSKKTRRIKWQDQMRPSSPFSVGSVKNIPKSNMIKGRLMSPTPMQFGTPSSAPQQIVNRDLELLYQSVNFKGPRHKKGDDSLQQNSQFQQLKEMSRTNFNDHKYMTSKLRRRGSLKPKSTTINKSHSASNIQSINALVGIYGNKNGKGLSRASSGQSFLTGLRNFNKLSMSNA